MNIWIKRLFFLTVFCTGAAVLIVEVSAVRLLAPYYGSSLYVLSSVLSVILFALSVGYYAGGKMADRFPFHVPLYMVITTAGLVLLALMFLAEYLLPALAPKQPLVTGPLFFSVVLFFIPAFMLGADSPYVIKLLALTARENEQGQLVGATFFWSTAGSIVGSLVSGFWFIPYYGLRETVVGTAIFLAIFGICVGLLIRRISIKNGTGDRRNNLKLQLPILVALSLLILFSSLIYRANVEEAVVYQTDGYHSRIKIYDGEYDGKPTRFMQRDINTSSAVFLEDNGLVFPYTQFAYLYTELKPDAKNFLVLGGGAYTVPREINLIDPDMRIDVVEIEPSLHELAVQYFDLPEAEKIINHNVDARVFLARTEKKYDVIFLDTFGSGLFVPSHLVTQEFFALLKTRLTNDGIVIINTIGTLQSKPGRSLTGSFNKTFKSVFPNNLMFSVRDTYPKISQNLMYVAKNGDSPIVISDPENWFIHTPGRDIPLSNLAIDTSFLANDHDQILTDNNSPVELLVLKERFAYPF
jgi:spermidine synthase